MIKDNIEPLHAFYVNAQNLVSLFVEHTSVLRPLHELHDFLAEMEDLYLPSYPPMSPITRSYLHTWEFFDVEFGPDKESVAKIMLDLAKECHLDSIQQSLIKQLSDSRMGIYEVTAKHKKDFTLTELLTNKVCTAMIPSGYDGKVGDLLYVRLVPAPELITNYYVAMTTPYVLLGTTKADWINFFARHDIKAEFVGYEARLHQLMKYGKERNYWAEYVFYAYFNYKPDRIFLAGIPDRLETQPCAKEFNPRSLNNALIERQLL